MIVYATYVVCDPVGYSMEVSLGPIFSDKERAESFARKCKKMNREVSVVERSLDVQDEDFVEIAFYA